MAKKPFNYHGCAYDKSLRGDKRQKRWTKQRKTRGFDETEQWGLAGSISAYILPRLKAFRDTHAGYPGCLNSSKEWDAILDEMIVAFELVLLDFEGTSLIGLENEPKVSRGLDLFAEWYLSLWS